MLKSVVSRRVVFSARDDGDPSFGTDSAAWGLCGDPESEATGRNSPRPSLEGPPSFFHSLAVLLKVPEGVKAPRASPSLVSVGAKLQARVRDREMRQRARTPRRTPRAHSLPTLWIQDGALTELHMR